MGLKRVGRQVQERGGAPVAVRPVRVSAAPPRLVMAGKRPSVMRRGEAHGSHGHSPSMNSCTSASSSTSKSTDGPIFVCFSRPATCVLAICTAAPASASPTWGGVARAAPAKQGFLSLNPGDWMHCIAVPKLRSQRQGGAQQQPSSPHGGKLCTERLQISEQSCAPVVREGRAHGELGRVFGVVEVGQEVHDGRHG